MIDSRETGEHVPHEVQIEMLQPEENGPAAELIRQTIEQSWHGIRPDMLNHLFQAKYTAESMAKRASEGTLWLAKDEQTQQPIGIIGLKGNQLRTFYVHPSAQGSGVGRKLFETLKAHAIAEGQQRIVLEGSEAGRPAYEKFGFKTVKMIPKEMGGYHYQDALMELDLTAAEEGE